MFKFLLTIILFLLASVISKAQVTHSIGCFAGLSNVVYMSDTKDTKSKVRGFLPSVYFDYSKHNDNVFWGGLSAGFTLRQVPLYTYENGGRSGVRLPELWARVRAGLKFEHEFTTQMPFLALGIAKHVGHEFYFANGTQDMTYTNQYDSAFKPRPYWPFVEAGSKLINTSFRQDKRNVSFTFSVRYYPMPIFTESFPYEYDYNQFKNIQYHLIEFCIIAGLQHNIQR